MRSIWNDGAPFLHAVTNFSAECVKEQEKLLAQRKVPGLQNQLEEFKSALCQLQAQKHRLQTEVSHHDDIYVHFFSFLF